MADLIKRNPSEDTEINRLRDLVERIKKEQPTAKETFELIRGVILHPPQLSNMSEEGVEKLVDQADRLADLMQEKGWEDMAKSVRGAIKNIK